MANRFPAFKRIRTRNITSVIKVVRVDSEKYDRSLFPVNVDTNIQDEHIAYLAVPSILRNKFKQEGISRLGQLQGLDVSIFLSWRGFGTSCFTVLCSFLNSLRSGELKKLHFQESVQTITPKELSPEILVFPIQKLNLPTLLKARFKSSYYLRSRQVTLDTVQDFLDAYECGRLSSPGIGLKTVQQVFKEIDTLRQRGSMAYLENVTLDNQSFLHIISLAREKLIPRESLIFDHRFVPHNASFLTLEAIAQQVALTRERVRQLEKALVKKFQSGTLREFGWAIRRNALKQFRNATDEFTFEQFISHDFFDGCRTTASKMPPPVLFLDRVFYATFFVTKNRIRLTDNARRNFT